MVSAPPPAPQGVDYWMGVVGTTDGLVEFFHGYIRFKYPDAVIRTNYKFDLDNADKCLDLLAVCQVNEESGLILRWVIWYVDSKVDPRNDKTMTLTALKNSWYDFRRVWESGGYHELASVARFFGMPTDAESTPTTTPTATATKSGSTHDQTP